MASIQLDRIEKRFDGDVVAVRELTLEIADGEFLVLVGASGCGKTTTLRMIAGLELPTSGRIAIGGRDVTDVPPRERDLAMVFQSYALYPHMTVRQNLGFGLRMRRTPAAEVARRVERVASSLGLTELLDRRPAALSGGQSQRVALGRAIVREPRAFLFDEPLSNLDARLRVETRAELIRLHRELGATMAYVTHDQVEAMTMGQRIALMHGGELQQVASPLQLYDRPANRRVATFIGSPPMNVLDGRIERDAEGARFVSPALSLAIPEVDHVGPAALGFRPEHGSLAPVEGATVTAAVRVVEPLGPETLVHARTGAGDAIVVRTAERVAPAVDERVGIRIDPGKLHLFAPDGRRLG